MIIAKKNAMIIPCRPPSKLPTIMTRTVSVAKRIPVLIEFAIVPPIRVPGSWMLDTGHQASDLVLPHKNVTPYVSEKATFLHKN
jgi:hypothetical protein